MACRDEALAKADNRAEFLISACNVGLIRADLIRAELLSVSSALKGGLITPETAVAWLRSAGMLEYFVTVPEAMVGKHEGSDEKAGG